MPGTVVLNPASVDGYGNPISITRDDAKSVNRVTTSSVVENVPDSITVTDGYANPISVIRDEAKSINRTATSSVVENIPDSITVTDGYDNPISVTRDAAEGVNRILASTEISNVPSVKILDSDGNELKAISEGNIYVLAVRDEEQSGLLRMIYSQLKKMNFYLSQMVDEEISDNDVEEM